MMAFLKIFNFLILTISSISILAKEPCQKAFDFKLRNQLGTLVSLDELIKGSKKDFIVVSIFQTTCIPCVDEIKYFQNLRKVGSDQDLNEFKLVLIDSNEDRQTTTNFLIKNRIQEEVVLNDPNGKLDKPYNITAIPKLIFIDLDKNIIASIEGAELNRLRTTNELAKIVINPNSIRKCSLAKSFKK